MKIYIKAFTFLFILGIVAFVSCNASAEVNTGIDVVLVMDSSGSMKTTDPLSLRIPAAKLFISLLDNDDRAGIVSFSDKGYPIIPLTPVNSAENRDRLFEAAEKISSTGLYTNLHDALSTGLAVLSRDINAGRTRFIILMSDGMMDAGSQDKDLSLTDEIKNDLTPRLEDEGVKVYTIAFTDQADRQLLEKLSKRTGGFYNLALTDKDFHLIFASIFESLKKPEMLPMDENGFLIDGSIDEVTIVATKGSPETQIHLNAPDGQRYSNRAQSTGIEWFVSENFDMITVQKPAEGRWDILFSTGEHNRAYIITDLKLQTNFDQLYSTFGDPLDIKIWLEKDGTVITEQDVLDKFDIHLEMTGPDGETAKLTPFNKGDGIFIRKVAPFTPGNYKLRIVARGNTFEREKAFVFNIADAKESKEDILIKREKEKKSKAEAMISPAETGDEGEAVSWAQVIMQFISINLTVGIIIFLYVKRKRVAKIPALQTFLPSIRAMGGKVSFGVKKHILRKNVEEPDTQPQLQEEDHAREKHDEPAAPDQQKPDMEVNEKNNLGNEEVETELSTQEAGAEQGPELSQKESADEEEPDMPPESTDAQQEQASEKRLTGEDIGEKEKPQVMAENADAEASEREETDAAEVTKEDSQTAEEAEVSDEEVQTDSSKGILNQDTLDELLKADPQEQGADSDPTQEEDAAGSESMEEAAPKAAPDMQAEQKADEHTAQQDNKDDIWAEALEAQKEAESEAGAADRTAETNETENSAEPQENTEQQITNNDQISQQDNIDDMWQEALQAQKEADKEIIVSPGESRDTTEIDLLLNEDNIHKEGS